MFSKSDESKEILKWRTHSLSFYGNDLRIHILDYKEFTEDTSKFPTKREKELERRENYITFLANSFT